MLQDHLDIQLIAIVTAVACALPGVFLVLRRMTLMSDAISHAILPGIVLAFFLTERPIVAAPDSRCGRDRCAYCPFRRTAATDETRERGCRNRVDIPSSFQYRDNSNFPVRRECTS